MPIAETRPAPPRLLAQLSETPPAGRILVIRLGALGDVVRTRFAFAALRALYPESHIDWLVEDRAAAGLEAIRGLDGIVRVARNDLRIGHPLAFRRSALKLVEKLRGGAYDLAVDFHGILKSGLLARAAGIPMRVGYDRHFSRDGSQRFLTHRVSIACERLSRFERNDALVRFLGGEPVREAPPLELSPDPAPELADLPTGLAVLHPGTSPLTLYKRWDPARFARLALILREKAGLESLITWGPVEGECEAAQQVVARAQGAAHLAPATQSISHLLQLMRGARLFVGSDSGPMHLASLLGLPLVAVFGPTDPVENAPFSGSPHRIVREDVGCNPCRLGCPSRACMSRIGVQDVASAALELLAGV
ncbi:MAG: glycosyltransferase family 9 protein [bacterium]|nr:glycosyltransferase family 9 protein [bacterium]